MGLKKLIGSGDKIGMFALPFLVIGVVLNLYFPSLFSAGGPPTFMIVISIAFMIPGVTIWLWSVALILTKVPKNELITSGAYSLVKHPIYTSVSLLVLPWIGILCNTLLGVLLGIAVYIGSSIYSKEEEKVLAKTFGTAWDDYCKRVKIQWL